jgi:hypothetical protein
MSRTVRKFATWNTYVAYHNERRNICSVLDGGGKLGQGCNKSEACPYAWNAMSRMFIEGKRKRKRVDHNERRDAMTEGGCNE